MPKTLLIVLAILVANAAAPQNAPITTLGSIASATPGSIQIPVTVTNFSDIGAIYLSIDYDYAVIQLTSATPHPQLPTFLYGDNDLGTGFHRITLGWYGNGLTLPDGSAIMTLSFNYTSGNSALSFYDNGPSCEYANGDGEVLNDTPAGNYYFDGQVCGLLGSPGVITGDNSVCQGETGVSYSIVPMASATVYTWSVPAGATIFSGQGTSLIMADFADNAASGNVQVFAGNPCGTGPSSQFPVTVKSLPTANAGNDFSIPYGSSTTLHAASGGSGSYSYHWSPEELLINPDVQDPVTVSLTSTTLFTLLVTNTSTFCQKSDETVVTITGGPLTVNPVAVPAMIPAGGTAQLYAFVSGGSGNYTYSWTTDPPGWSSNVQNPAVSPDNTTLYLLTVNDGFNDASGSINLQVHAAVTATISGTDTLCGSGNTTILTVDLTGVPPWNFVYTFGSISVLVAGHYTSPYSLLTGTAGTYTISFVEDAFFRGAGMGAGQVALYPVPPAPQVSLIETTLVSNACCGNQWYRNDTAIPGATGVSYTATESGKYYDIVTRFSCVSDTSNAIDVIIDGLSERNQAVLGVYPNPATERIHVRLNMDDGRLNIVDCRLSVVDICGREVNASLISSPRVGGGREGGWEIDVSSLPPGLYFVVVKVDQTVWGTSRFVKAIY